jgi:murein DD-endopeptidase MepM/ murein hydrolase activator NlpD
MPPRHDNNGILLTIAAIGVAALTAFPAPTQAQERGPAPTVQSISVARISPKLGPIFATEAAKAAEPTGPFVPVVGKVDYGTAENVFGAARSGHTHAGQDMFAPAGTPEVAATDAVVLEIGADGGQGNYVYLYDAKRDRTYVYMHMIAPPIVQQGEKVKAGQKLGGLGCTGSCWGDHLHFEIHDGKGFEAPARDPLPELKDWHALKKPL